MRVAFLNPGWIPCCLLPLAALLSLAAQATEPDVATPGLATTPQAVPSLPLDLVVRAPWDPGPPLREPIEQMEPDPAWDLPTITRSTDRVPAPGIGRSLNQVTLKVAGVDHTQVMSLLKRNLLYGTPLPFFKASPGEPVGKIKYFYHETVCKPPLRQLTPGKYGVLYWLGESGDLKLLTPAGMHTSIGLCPNRVLHALARNPAGDLFYFGDQEWGTLTNELLDPRVCNFICDASKSTWKVRLAVPGLAGGCFILEPSGLHLWDGEGKVKTLTPPGDRSWFQATSLAPRGDGNSIVAVRADTFEVFKEGVSGRSFGIRLDERSRPHSAAPGPHGETWVTLEGRDTYLVFKPGDGEVLEMNLPSDPGGPRGLRALTMGPDGNMWFALARTGALMRMTPDGDFVTFGLLPGDVPAQLVPTDTGILFTLEGSSRIGFIRALPEPEAKGWTEPIRKPRPVREKQLSREQAHALHEARMVRAQQRAEARQAEAAAAGQPAPAEPVETKDVEKVLKPKAEAPVPAAAQEPWDTLAGLGVYLTPGDLQHILDGHAHDEVYREPRTRPGRGRGDRRQPGEGGRFAAVHSTEQGQLALLAAALKEAGEIGRITDDRGRYYTKCRMPNVGFYHAHGAQVATDHVLVVMDRAYNEQLDDYEYGIVTAFPVHPNW